jgi:hypothetical protein
MCNILLPLGDSFFGSWIVQAMDVEVIYKNLHKTIKLIPENFIHHLGKGANRLFLGQMASLAIQKVHCWWSSLFSLYHSSRAILICQKPDSRSRAENVVDFPNCAKTSSIKGKGYV